MRQCLLWRRRRYLRERRLSERPTGSSQDEPPHLASVPCPQALMNRIVLAINREDFDILLARCGHHQFASGNQHFLIAQRNLLAQADRFVGSLEPTTPTTTDTTVSAPKWVATARNPAEPYCISGSGLTPAPPSSPASR